MSKGRNQHIVPRNGRWAVQPAGGGRASSVHDTGPRRSPAAAKQPGTSRANC